MRWIWEFTSLWSEHKWKTTLKLRERCWRNPPQDGGGSPCIMAELGWQEAWYALRKWNGLASLLVCYAAWPHEYEREIVSAQRSLPVLHTVNNRTEQNRAERSSMADARASPSPAPHTRQSILPCKSRLSQSFFLGERESGPCWRRGPHHVFLYRRVSITCAQKIKFILIYLNFIIYILFYLRQVLSKNTTRHTLCHLN